MKTIPIMSPDGKDVLGNLDPSPLLEELEQRQLANSSSERVALSDIEEKYTEQGAELASLRDLQRTLGNQMSTIEGFAEMARAAHLFDSKEGGDLAAIAFMEQLGKGHLVKQAAMNDTAIDTEADELKRIAAALNN
jgi:hypothetical protein